jgi:hypothetical protein
VILHAEPATRALSARRPGRKATLAERIAPVAAPALLASASLALFASSTARAPRLALLLHAGDEAASGRAFALGWLDGFVLRIADALGGYAGAAALGAAALFALAAFVYARASERAGVTLSLVAGGFALFTCCDAARVGGDAAAWLGAAALLYALDRAPKRALWVAPAIAVLWCNASAAGVLAPALALLVALGRAADAGDAGAARRCWPVVSACALATLCTPALWAYPGQAFAALHFDPQFSRILPIAPATAAPHAFRIALTLVVIAAAWLWAGRRRLRDAPLVLAAFVLCFFDGAFLPLLGIVAGPAFAAAARAPAEPVPAMKRSETLAAWCAGALVACAALFTLPHVPARSVASESPLPLFAALSARGGEHLIYCAAPAYCDYAETLPGLRPFLDERVEAVSPATLQTQEKIARVRAGWQRALREARIDAMLVASTSALAQLIPAVPGWKAAGSDGDARLFVLEGGAR